MDIRLSLTVAVCGPNLSRKMDITSVNFIDGELHLRAFCVGFKGDHVESFRVTDQYGFIDHILQIQPNSDSASGILHKNGNIEANLRVNLENKICY